MGKRTGLAFASRSLLLCALLLAASPPARADLDPNEPAELIVQTLDSQKKPIEGVNIEFMPGSRADAYSLYAKGVTDANGIAVLRMACPEAEKAWLLWEVWMRCNKAGLPETYRYATLFPGARVPMTVTLPQLVTIRLRVLDPQGQPLARLPLWAGDTWGQPRQTTDDQGVFVGKCPRSQEPQKVEIGSLSFPMTYEAEQTLRLNESQMAQLPLHRRLQGRLLDANGSPARGAAVAQARVCMELWNGGSCFATYAADPVTRVDHDGRFTLDLADRDVLAVFSPGGIPFLYHLNLGCWPDVRRATLHLPPVQGVHKGQLVWPDGKPAAGVILAGHLNAGNMEIGRSDPNDVPRIRTDAEGRFEAPLYFDGSRAFKANNASVGPWDVIKQEKVIVKPLDLSSHQGRDLRNDSRPTHRYFLRIRDANGQEIQNPKAMGCRNGFGGQASQPSSDMHTTFLPDARGLVMLTDRPAGKLPISILAPGYRPVNETIDLPAAEDSTIDITLPDAQRSHVVRGKILDPNGQLVKGVHVESYRVAPPDKNARVGVIRDRAHGESGEFDPDGGFRLQKLDEGMADVSGGDSPLPGWTDEVPYDANTKDLVIQLRRGGMVRALVPEGLNPANVLVLEYAGEIHQDTSWRWPSSCREGNAMVFSHVRPGSWDLKLLESSLEPFRTDRSERTTLGRVEVKDGEETVLDLRQKLEQMPMLQTVKFTAGGKPISGAAVRVYATWATDDANLAACVKELASDNVKVGEQADASLRQAGKAGTGAILAARIEDPNARLLAQAILDPQQLPYGPRPVTPKQADITDDDGAATFSLHSGRRYIVVARLPGKWIGLTAFTTATKPAAPVEIIASRARTLQFTAADPNSLDYRHFESSIRCDFLAPDEAMALMDALGSWAEPALSPAGHAMEDLPTGRSYELSWQVSNSNRSGKERIDLAADGNMIQPVPLDLPAPSSGPMVPTTMSAP